MPDREPFTIGLHFTADVLVPDEPCSAGDTDACRCTNLYGEPTEHGYGETMYSGWCDPAWSPYSVDEDTGQRPDPITFSYIDPDPDEDPLIHLWAAITHVISVDHVEHGETMTIYPADPIRNYRTGEESMIAAHVYGLGPAEAERLHDLLKG